jgi:hypothetical protein
MDKLKFKNKNYIYPNINYIGAISEVSIEMFQLVYPGILTAPGNAQS